MKRLFGWHIKPKIYVLLVTFDPDCLIISLQGLRLNNYQLAVLTVFRYWKISQNTLFIIFLSNNFYFSTYKGILLLESDSSIRYPFNLWPISPMKLFSDFSSLQLNTDSNYMPYQLLFCCAFALLAASWNLSRSLFPNFSILYNLKVTHQQKIWLQAFSPFPTMFSKDLFPSVV